MTAGVTAFPVSQYYKPCCDLEPAKGLLLKPVLMSLTFKPPN